MLAYMKCGFCQIGRVVARSAERGRLENRKVNGHRGSCSNVGFKSYVIGTSFVAVEATTSFTVSFLARNQCPTQASKTLPGYVECTSGAPGGSRERCASFCTVRKT